jgi:hypothetical protein
MSKKFPFSLAIKLQIIMEKITIAKGFMGFFIDLLNAKNPLTDDFLQGENDRRRLYRTTPPPLYKV